MDELIVQGEINSKIFILRGKQVMLDRDLAELYDVETKYLKRQVQRNYERFDEEDFMSIMTKEEFEHLRSQIGTANAQRPELCPMSLPNKVSICWLR